MLDLLLREEGRGQIPAPEELPSPAVFLDIECRNIYEAFCALYTGARTPPDFQTLKSRLGEGDATVARLAKIMLEREVTSGRIALPESLDKLTDRWRRQRIKELHGEINEAQRKGDHALLRPPRGREDATEPQLCIGGPGPGEVLGSVEPVLRPRSAS